MDVETKLKILPLRALAASTGKDLPLIKKYYETSADAAKAYKVNLEETYTAADSLAQQYGPEAANGMIAGVAQPPRPRTRVSPPSGAANSAPAKFQSHISVCRPASDCSVRRAGISFCARPLVRSINSRDRSRNNRKGPDF